MCLVSQHTTLRPSTSVSIFLNLPMSSLFFFTCTAKNSTWYIYRGLFSILNHESLPKKFTIFDFFKFWMLKINRTVSLTEDTFISNNVCYKEILCLYFLAYPQGNHDKNATMHQWLSICCTLILVEFFK